MILPVFIQLSLRSRLPYILSNYHSSLITPILKMRKLRHMQAKYLPQLRMLTQNFLARDLAMNVLLIKKVSRSQGQARHCNSFFLEKNLLLQNLSNSLQNFTPKTFSKSIYCLIFSASKTAENVMLQFFTAGVSSTESLYQVTVGK